MSKQRVHVLKSVFIATITFAILFPQGLLSQQIHHEPLLMMDYDAQIDEWVSPNNTYWKTFTPWIFRNAQNAPNTTGYYPFRVEVIDDDFTPLSTLGIDSVQGVQNAINDWNDELIYGELEYVESAWSGIDIKAGTPCPNQGGNCYVINSNSWTQTPLECIHIYSRRKYI